MTTTNKTITITMSDRSPIKIVAADWPVIARADWHSGSHACQANEEAWLKVREHEDGRRIIYSDRDSGPGGMAIGYRGTAAGYLIGAPNAHDCTYGVARERAATETVRAIRRAAGVIDRPELGDACIADLPAEELA